MVPKRIGTKELENQQYIGQTTHKYVHIDMKLNFMHILAIYDSMEYTLYNGSKKAIMLHI